MNAHKLRMWEVMFDADLPSTPTWLRVRAPELVSIDDLRDVCDHFQNNRPESPPPFVLARTENPPQLRRLAQWPSLFFPMRPPRPFLSPAVAEQGSTHLSVEEARAMAEADAERFAK